MLLVEKFFGASPTRPSPTPASPPSADLRVLRQARQVDAGREGARRRRQVPRQPQDHGFMYSHGYEDLDGHTWELVHMSGAPPSNSNALIL
jgi:hypothetical protein